MHSWAKYDDLTEASFWCRQFTLGIYFKTIGLFDYAESQEMNSGD